MRTGSSADNGPQPDRPADCAGRRPRARWAVDLGGKAAGDHDPAADLVAPLPGCDGDQVPVRILVQRVPSPSVFVRWFKDRNPEHGRPRMDRVDILHGDSDLGPGGTPISLALRQLQHHVLAGGNVSPRQVIVQGFVSRMSVRLVIEFES
jgi:hypothetical protein